MRQLSCTACGQELSGNLDTFGVRGEECCFSCFITISDVPEIVEEDDYERSLLEEKQGQFRCYFREGCDG